MDDLFPSRKIMIVNLRICTWVLVKGLLASHILACIFVIVSNEKLEKDFEDQHQDDEINRASILKFVFESYVDTIYFMIMTMSTVGYGVPYALSRGQKELMMIVEFFGIALFTTVTNEVFNYRTSVNVDTLVKN